MRFYEENKEYSSRILVQDKEKSFTYADMEAFSKEIGKVVEKRQTVLVLSHNTSATLLGVMAFIKNSLVTIDVDGSLPEKLIEDTVNRFQPNYIYLQEEEKEKYDGFSTIFEVQGMALLKNEVMSKPIENEDVGLLLSTSGSTGSPKFVKLSLDEIEANVSNINDMARITKDDACITVLPMNFSYCVESVFRFIKAGARIIITDASTVKNEFWELCEKYKPTYFFAVPFVYENIFKLGIQDRLGQFKSMSVAGGKPSHSLIERLCDLSAKKDIEFFTEYGQTDSGGLLAINTLTKDGMCNVADDVGSPHPSCKLIIDDGEGHAVTECDVEGELVFSGPNVSMGYANNYDDLNKPDEHMGTIRTGDVGVRRTDGTIHIVGRIKRFLKIYGKRYSLDYMETTMKTELNQSDIVCVGRDDFLVVYCTEDETVKKIKNYLRNIYKLSVRNFSVRCIEAFPLRPNGKIDYTTLTKMSNE